MHARCPARSVSASSELTVDCKVEQRKIALTVLNLKSDPNSPDLFGRRGRFWPTRHPLFQTTREAALSILTNSEHGRPPRPTAPTAAPKFSRPAILPQLHRTGGTFPLNSRCQTESGQRLNAVAPQGTPIHVDSRNSNVGQVSPRRSGGHEDLTCSGCRDNVVEGPVSVPCPPRPRFPISSPC